MPHGGGEHAVHVRYHRVVYCPNNAGGGARIERSQSGQPANPVFPVSEQVIEEDGHQQDREENGCHSANRGANMIEQIAAGTLHAIDEFRPDRCFVDRYAGGQCVDDPVGCVGDKSWPTAFLQRSPAQRVVGGRQFLGDRETRKREDDSHYKHGREGGEESG